MARGASKRAFALALLARWFFALAIGAVALRDSDGFERARARTLLVLRGNEARDRRALRGPHQIWRTATAMGGEHPSPASACADSAMRIRITRAGRSFRRYGRATTGASHAHQIVLELLSETGVIGLLLWLAGAWFAIRAWRRAGPAARARAFAPGLALAAMCFPLNTHLAFYSAWWGLLFWWLLSLVLRGARAREDVVDA